MYFGPMPFSNLIVSRVRTAAREDRHELVIAGLQIADVQALHAALDQGFGLALRVEIVRNILVVDLQLHGVEAEELTHVHRHEDRGLRVRRKQ